MARRLRFTVAVFVTAILAMATAACRSDDDARAPRRMVLISVDTLRADRLGCYGYDRYGRSTSPIIDGLASHGTLFENADAPRGMTWPTLTTILTGKYPITHGVRNNGDNIREKHRLLSEILSERGYATGGFTTNMVRAPNRGFDDLRCYMDTMENIRTQAEWDRQATADSLEWLDSHREEDFFLWVHYFGTHKPYTPEPEFRVFVNPEKPPLEVPEGFVPPKPKGRVIPKQEDPLDQYLQTVTGQGIDLAPHEVDYVNALYDGEVLAVDGEVARILAKLDELGIADDTLVVFVSDHGEELYERNHYFYHSCSVYQSVLHVPLIVRMPGRVAAGKRIPEPVELTDLVPTILDLLGEPPADEGFEGVTLVPLLDGSGARGRDISIAEWYHTKSIEGRQPIYTAREGNWKLVWNPDGIHPELPPYRNGSSYAIGREELYDLGDDPRERRNVAGENPAQAARLRGRIEEFLEAHRGREGIPAPMSREMIRRTVERLVELGYLLPEKADEEIERLEREHLQRGSGNESDSGS